MLNGSMRKVDDDDGSIRWRMTFCSFGSIVLRMGREHPGVSNGAAGVSRIRGGPTDTPRIKAASGVRKHCYSILYRMTVTQLLKYFHSTLIEFDFEVHCHPFMTLYHTHSASVA